MEGVSEMRESECFIFIHRYEPLYALRVDAFLGASPGHVCNV